LDGNKKIIINIKLKNNHLSFNLLKIFSESIAIYLLGNMLKLQLQLIPLMLIIMRFLFVFDVFRMEFVVLLAADFVHFGGYFSLSYFLQYK